MNVEQETTLVPPLSGDHGFGPILAAAFKLEHHIPPELEQKLQALVASQARSSSAKVEARPPLRIDLHKACR
jgi:hypothetical protein